MNLRFKKPFIIGCISGAIGAVVASFFNPYYYVYAGLPGPLTIVNTINSDNPSSFIGVCIGVAIAIILPIVLIQIFGYGDDSVKQADIEPVKLNNDAETTTVQEDLEVHIQAPLTGDVIALSDVADPVFSSGAMGDGLAIKPTKNEVVAPVDGSIVMTTPSKHAIGIRSNSGIEILIHVGMDTVQLNGEHFELLVQDGDAITAGQPLLRFDTEAIEQAGYSTVTPVIITNHAEFNELIKTTDKSVAHGDNIIEVIKK